MAFLVFQGNIRTLAPKNQQNAMKIGFDGKRAAQNRTGLGNYSRLIVRILSEQYPDNEYHLYVPNEHRAPLLAGIPTLKRLRLHYPEGFLWSRLRSLWRTMGISNCLHRDGIDVYHGLSAELPYGIRRSGARSVVTVHDLIFLSCPQYYKPIDRFIYNIKCRAACRAADRVIAISEFTKQEIIRHYNIPESKISVVYQGCDPLFSQPIADDKLQDVRRRYNLPERFILFVGSIEERKNLLLVAKAIKRMVDGGRPLSEIPPVVAVGKRTPYTAGIEQYLSDNGLSSHFMFFHKLPFADLPSFYRLAHLFVYPSRIEGFGIPLLEALCSSVPVIGCTGSCLEEAGGPHSLYTSPDSPDEMAAAIARVLDDSSLRASMIAHGHEYAARFSDEALGKDIMRVLEEVAQGK